MATPIIQSNQAGPGLGTAGEGRDDLLLNVAIALSDTEAANSGASYEWFLDDIPPDSTASLSGATTATPTINNVNVPGSHWVRCLVDGVDTAKVILAVKFATLGERFPAFGEGPGDYDAASETQAYHRPFYGALKVADANLLSLQTDLDIAEASLVTAEADIVALEALINGNPLVDGEHITAEAFTVGTVLSISHTLGRAYKGFICTNGLKITELASQTDKTDQIDLMVTGPELIETITVTGSDADEVTFSDLDGDADEEYTVKGWWRKVTGTGASSWLQMRPNDIITNQRWSGMYVIDGGSIGTPGSTGMTVAYLSGTWDADASAQFTAQLHAKTATGQRRAFWAQQGGIRTGEDLVHTSGGGWDDTSTNITSIVLKGTRATDIHVGSRFELWCSNPRKTTADIWIF